MPVSRFWMPIVVIGVLLGTVFGSQALGWWAISGRASVNLDQFAPEDIKGWMSLQQVADGLQLPVEEVYRIGGIPADIAPDTALKDLEDIVEVSTLRETLADPAAGSEPPEPTTAPTEAATDSAPEPTPTATVSSPKATAAPENALHTGDGTGPTPLPPGQILPADQIKGRMTLREISDQCAVDLVALLAALDLPPDTDPDTQLKTLTQAGTLEEVTQVQDAVAILQG